MGGQHADLQQQLSPYPHHRQVPALYQCQGTSRSPLYAILKSPMYVNSGKYIEESNLLFTITRKRVPQ